MPVSGIKVLVVGKRFELPYEMRHVEDPGQIHPAIAQFQPDVIVTSTFIPGILSLATFELRKRWIHVDPNAGIDDICRAIEGTYSFNLWGVHVNQPSHPLISVFTGTYNTGSYLRETYQSLKDQSYPNWEWVVVDDHSDDGTWERLTEMAKEDFRVRPFRSGKRLSKIGAVKDTATRLAKGAYLVELDHDDMLTDFALGEIKAAFESDPEVGFVYSNSSNFFENGSYHRFTDEFWTPRYRETEYRGRKWVECLQPDIYDRFGPDFTQQFGWFLTVGPNHVRSFRANKLFELGGYNPNLPVADDWDLYARFFLRSKCLLVPKMLYLYRFKDAWSNTTFKRNQAIQDHLAYGRSKYAEEFKKFNALRLQSKAPAEAAAAASEEVLLTIAVCTMPSRMEGFSKVAQELTKQAEGKPVEIFGFFDNRKSNLSEKRNLVIAGAKGKFISFVDDDDRVEPDYVDAILNAVRQGPDADCVVFDVMVHGYTPEPKVCKYDSSYTHGEDASAYYRKPNHVMAYRTEISRRHKFRKDLSAISEDTEWAERASADIKKQLRIQKVLYHYQYDATKTTQLRPAPQAAPAENPKEAAPAEATPPAAPKWTLKDVSFIVLEASPLSTPLTVRCLRSIREHAPGAEIVMVDNGSATSTAWSADKEVHFDVNLGFAAGCNAGAAAASRPVLCFMNNDAAFVDDLTPQLLVERITSTHPITAPFSNRAKPPQGDIPREMVPSIDVLAEMVVGLCMMVPKGIFNALGGFNPRLLTYEDDEFCLKAKLRGWQCKIVGGTWVEHERHATFKALGLDAQKVMDHNRMVFQRLNPKIRVVVIAKDEEKAIVPFFAQFAAVTRDWCLLDTGSTDRTVQKAKSMGVRVESAPFLDFASARNEALERFGDGADWFVMFDPDERLDVWTIQHLKDLAAGARHDVFLSPLFALYPDKTRRDFVPKPFLFRNSPEIRWTFKVHEKLVGSRRQALVKNAAIMHIIALHEDGRRQKAGSMYDALMKAESYFMDPAYKAKMIRDWPILDYDRMDDSRIEKIYLGPLVSVVMPTYKRRALCEKAISSVLKQDYVNCEVVVVGDNCPDLDIPFIGSHTRVRAYNLKHNHGAGGAVPRNHAISAAAGELIAYLDDDNEWKPDHLSTVIEAMRSKNASFAFSSMEVDGKDLGFTEPKYQGIDTSCVVHHKSLVEKYGFWKDRIEGGYAHDWEFISRWVKGGEKWACTKKPTLIYNAETSGQAEFLKSAR